MFISEVRVTNFRSLVDANVNLTGYTALVGLNDAGKSNLLRAMNLFFNGETDLGEQLSFERDFSQNAKTGVKKARQITIEIDLNPPGHYRDADPIVWRKTYRAGSTSPHSDEVFRKDGQAFSPKSRTAYWARSMAFEYVPAVRGRAFFNNLKRRLHATLAATVAPKLTSASDAFLAGLRAEVQAIENESKRLLDLRTEFSLPSDLGDLFEALEFNSGDSSSVTTALTYRGDGVQGRHVPLILKFLADQRKKNSVKGRAPSETVWGFEEPENNLELARQIDVSQEFETYCRDVQIIVSTHSPAFYRTAKSSGIGSLQFASRKNGATTYESQPVAEAVDGTLGLMPFVEPYLEEAVKHRDQLLTSIRDAEAAGLLAGGDAIYVEGETDATILMAAAKSLDTDLRGKIVYKSGLGAGANWVADCCIARIALPDLTGISVALFDYDEAGRKASEHLKSCASALKRQEAVRIEFVGKKAGDDHVRAIRKSGVKISFSIDELCPESAWRHAESKGWLESRSEELAKLNIGLAGMDQTLNDAIDAKLPDAFHRLPVKNRIRGTDKLKFSKHVAKEMANTGTVPPTLAELIKTLAGKFQK